MTVCVTVLCSVIVLCDDDDERKGDGETRCQLIAG